MRNRFDEQLYELNREIIEMGAMCEEAITTEIVTFLNGRTMEGMELIEEMARETIEMVTASVDAFVKKDVELAQKVIEQDDIVDDYFSRVKCGIITLIAENHADGEFALDLLMISKYFERIGDHATNIAEWVIYSVTGTHKEV